MNICAHREQFRASHFMSLVLMDLSGPDFYDQLTRKNDSREYLEMQFIDGPASYSHIILHAAFLIGYAQFEAFLADGLKEFYASYPDRLPGEKKLDVKDVLGALNEGGADGVRDLVIAREVRNFFAGSLDAILKNLEKLFQFQLNDDRRARLVEASLLRNSLMHNGGIASVEMAFSKCPKGKYIQLSREAIVQFGDDFEDVVGNTTYSRAWI